MRDVREFAHDHVLDRVTNRLFARVRVRLDDRVSHAIYRVTDHVRNRLFYDMPRDQDE